MKKKILLYTCILLLLSTKLFAYEYITGKDAISLLKKGGYVVYMRHGVTDHTQDDHFPIDLNDCATQRNLSKQGIDESKNVHKSIKKHKINFDKIISSPFCRCIDTAKYAAGDPVIDNTLYFAVDVKADKRALQSKRLKEMLSEKPKNGTNRLIVSHTANLKEAANIWPKPEGVAYIFYPKGNGQFEAIGRLEPSDWK
jgi:phosphohistidine phosphatase SixA